MPEICDGKDNDCDGAIDESGPQPDGIDGTADPNDTSRKLGDACGVNVGECRQGRLGCVAGRVLCTGTVGPQPEQCDCKDNDCNGQVDDEVGRRFTALRRRQPEVRSGGCRRLSVRRTVPQRRIPVSPGSGVPLRAHQRQR